mmetsp:Transcript_13882/g.29178  ORF Transcript_13882/g.29178 Transcript_13882/m.29178 type:complete len:206 (-) Transcript_13882:595-1212(-)
MAADVGGCPHRPLPPIAGEARGFDGGFGLVTEGGPPNPIEAKISSSEAPRSVFFLGFEADALLGVFFGPRLVIPIVMPPIVPGSPCGSPVAPTDSVRVVVAVDAILEGRGVAIAFGIGTVFAAFWLCKEVAEIDDPVDRGAIGMREIGGFVTLLPPTVDGETVAAPFSAIEVFFVATGRWGDDDRVFVSLSSSKEGFLCVILVSL